MSLRSIDVTIANILGALLAIAILSFAFCKYLPNSGGGTYDFDEGINLSKAFLYQQNYSLYEQIWSDQPPLFTSLLSFWGAQLGNELIFARLLLIIITSLLVVGVFKIINKSSITIFIGLAVVIVLFRYSNLYLLANRIMIGLPAITLAVWAYLTLITAKDVQSRFLFLCAGILFGLALLTKYFVLVLLPALAIELLWKTNRPSLVALKYSTRLWLFGFLLTFAGLGYTLAPAYPLHFWGQSIVPHLDAKYEYGPVSFNWLIPYLRVKLILLVIIAIGAKYLYLAKDFRFISALVWFVSAVLFLSLHRPVWYHHDILIEVPLFILVGLTLAACTNEIFDDKLAKKTTMEFRRPAFGAIILFLIFLTLLPLNILFARPSFSLLTTNEKILDTIKDESSESDFIVSDRLIYPYLAKRKVIPELAVFSEKRRKTKNLDEKQLSRLIEDYKPKFILLLRFHYDYRSFVSKLTRDGNYQHKIYMKEGYFLKLKEDAA